MKNESYGKKGVLDINVILCIMQGLTSHWGQGCLTARWIAWTN
jgi:hypothetical protein